MQRCAGKTVLDYCCGNGQQALWLSDHGAVAHGIDISPVSIENARREAKRRGLSSEITFQVMDAEATGFADSFFDLVVISGVLHHLDLDRAYRELARILKPNGQIIVTEALRHNLLIHWYRKLTPHLRSAWETEHILGKEEIFSASRYFGEVRVERFFHLATLGAVPFRNLSLFTPALKALQTVDTALFRLPWLKWQAWMAVFVLGQPIKGQSSS
ncbi:MAG: class I SAM-dependent methyltransferase [Nitrospira sp.]|nr:class I SAM-dependent methyltransferase [Nitrospira sp.]